MTLQRALHGAFDSFVECFGLARAFQVRFFDHFVARRMHDALAMHPLVVVRFTDAADYDDDGDDAHSRADASLGVYELRVRFVRFMVAGEATARLPKDVRGHRALTHDVPLFVECAASLVRVGAGAHANVDVLAERVVAVKCAHLPVMVGSSLCRTRTSHADELGGYFVVRGIAYVLVTQEQRANNNVTRVVDPKTGDCVVSVRSVMERRFLNKAVEKLRPPSVFKVVVEAATGRLLARHARFAKRTDVHVLDLLALFGVALPDHPRARALARVHGPPDRAAPARALTSPTADFFTHEMLPHVEPPTLEAVGMHVQRMALDALLLADYEYEGDDSAPRPDCIDDVSNTRLETCDVLLYELFATQFERWASDAARSLRGDAARVARAAREVGFGADAGGATASAISAGALAAFHSFERAFDAARFTNVLRDAIVTGKWPTSRSDVTEMLADDNAWRALEHVRKSVVPTAARPMKSAAQLFDPTQTGFFCPMHTPDNEKCGFVKHAALCALVSADSSEAFTREAWASAPPGQDDVVLDGVLVARAKDGAWIARWIRSARGRVGLGVAFDVGVTHVRSARAVFVRARAGRMVQVLATRELVHRARAGAALPTAFGDLVHAGLVEAVDAHEAWWDSDRPVVLPLTTDVFDEVEHTHARLVGTAHLSVLASMMPFADHNYGPRLSFWLNMAKQASPPLTWLPASHALETVQRPVATTHVARAVRETGERSTFSLELTTATATASQSLSHTALGVGLVVVVALHESAQEDSVAIKRSTIERGALRIIERESYEFDIDLDAEEVTPNPKCQNDGIVRVETYVFPGEVLVSKRDKATGRDTSCRAHRLRGGRVERVEISPATDADASAKGSKIRRVKIDVRTVLALETGDKLAADCGQKFVTAELVNDWDMMVSLRTGAPPDLVINAHSLPTRLTLGMLLGIVFSKMAYINGTGVVDASAFESASASEFGGTVRSDAAMDEFFARRACGSDARERFIDGKTGLMIETPLVCGVMYVHREGSKTAANAVRARAHGMKDSLTRLPTWGRAREGAVRYGEMENEAMVSHGASAGLIDRNMDSGDLMEYVVCATCGAFVDDLATCRACGKNGDPKIVRTKHTARLAFMELAALGISAAAFPASGS